MPDHVLPDTGPEAQAGVVPDQFCELAIHVCFNSLPRVSETTDSEGKTTMEYGPPFLKFPVNLSAKDAAILEGLFETSTIALVGFEIKDRDGKPRSYTSLVSRGWS